MGEVKKQTKLIPQHGEINELAILCKVHRITVRRALAGETSTPRAMLIRKVALARGRVSEKMEG